jgi:hypothetical protein
MELFLKPKQKLYLFASSVCINNLLLLNHFIISSCVCVCLSLVEIMFEEEEEKKTELS